MILVQGCCTMDLTVVNLGLGYGVRVGELNSGAGCQC